MIRAEIIVRGRVQKVGYRSRVEDIGRELGLKGFVENRRDGSVKIVCEGERDLIRDFIKRIDIRDDIVRVDEIEVKYLAATGKYKYFIAKKKSASEEISEGLEAILKHLLLIEKILREDVEYRRRTIEALNRIADQLKELNERRKN